MSNVAVRPGAPFGPVGTTITVELARGATTVASVWPQDWCRTHDVNPIKAVATEGEDPFGRVAFLVTVDDEDIAAAGWTHTPVSGVRLVPRKVGTTTLRVKFASREFTYQLAVV